MARRSNRSNNSDVHATFRTSVGSLVRTLTGPKIPTLRDARRTFESAYVRYVIARKQNRAAAARTLRIGLSTLKEKIRTRR
jgi:hypothetical protein